MITIERMFDLMEQGLFRTLALTTAQRFSSTEIDRMTEYCRKRFGSCLALDMSSPIIRADLEKVENNACVVVRGFSTNNAHHEAAYAMRTAADIHRQQYFLFFLSLPSFKRHFYDKDAPFYLFCHEIDFDNGLQM